MGCTSLAGPCQSIKWCYLTLKNARETNCSNAIFTRLQEIFTLNIMYFSVNALNASSFLVMHLEGVFKYTKVAKEPEFNRRVPCVQWKSPKFSIEIGLNVQLKRGPWELHVITAAIYAHLKSLRYPKGPQNAVVEDTSILLAYM